MIKDVSNLSRRNSFVMSEDFDALSLRNFQPEDKDWVKKRYSTHLQPTDLPPSYGMARRSASSDAIVRKRVKDTSLDEVSSKELEDHEDSSSPWTADEKISGTTHTLKVSR